MRGLVLYIFVILSFSSYSFCNEDNNLSIENNTTEKSKELFFEETSQNNITKEEKLIYLNVFTSLGIIAYGVEHWGYSTDIEPHTQNEGWFGAGTEEGGADKFGHAYTGYSMAHTYASIYESWGYDKDNAALYGAWSSFGFTSIMEFGDSFSDYGISYEDMIVNTLGALFGYVSYKYPYIGDKIDFRIEYKLHKKMWEKDFLTDYENAKYLFALKGSGFKSLESSKYMKYFELYLGYYVRGFKPRRIDRERNLFIGLGVNLSELLDTKIFKYYQIPKSYINTTDKL